MPRGMRGLLFLILFGLVAFGITYWLEYGSSRQGFRTHVAEHSAAFLRLLSLLL